VRHGWAGTPAAVEAIKIKASKKIAFVSLSEITSRPRMRATRLRCGWWPEQIVEAIRDAFHFTSPRSPQGKRPDGLGDGLAVGVERSARPSWTVA
jgi:hypothetical protein